MKKIMSLMMAGILAFGMTACGSGGGQSGESSGSGDAASGGNAPASSSPASEGAAVSGGTELTMWIFLNPSSQEDPRNVVLKEIVEEYNANNTMGNHVTVESIHYSKIESQAIQAAAAGTGPDIINIYTDMLKQHIAGGTVQPMTQLAEPFIKDLPGYTYSADSLKIGGEIYTLPWESRTFTYWYRSDIFSQVPTTLNELAAMAGEKSDAMHQGFVIGLSDQSNAASFMESFIPFIRSAGGELFDDSGKAVFNSEAGVKALTYLKELVDKGAMDKTVLSMSVDEIVDAFKAGTILSCNAGTQRAAAIRSSELTGNIKSAPILGFESGKPSPAIIAGQSLGIGKHCKNLEAAFDFIKTFYTQENQVKWLKANVLPAVSTAYEDESIKALANYDEIKSWNAYAADGKVQFYPEDYSELSVKLVQAAQNAVFNGADPKASLDEVANWYNSKHNF